MSASRAMLGVDIIGCVILGGSSDDTFENLVKGLTGDAVDEASVARHNATYSLMWAITSPYSVPPIFDPRHIRRAKRVMQVYTNDRSYSGDTPSVVMQEIAYVRAFNGGRPMFDALSPLVARWSASRLALVLRPVGMPGHNAIVDLLYVQDGEGVIAKTVRDFVREMSVL